MLFLVLQYCKMSQKIFFCLFVVVCFFLLLVGQNKPFDDVLLDSVY